MEERIDQKKFRLNSKKAGTAIKIIFILYILFLFKAVLFKYPLHMMLELVKGNDLDALKRNISLSNMIPFETIFNYGGRVFYSRVARVNIAANILLFIPLGSLSPVIWEGFREYKKIILLSASLSLFFEVIQLLSGTGSFDIDDLLLNITGSVIGLSILDMAVSALKRRHSEAEA